MNSFTESVIEQAAIDWFTGLGYACVFGPDIACNGMTSNACHILKVPPGRLLATQVHGRPGEGCLIEKLAQIIIFHSSTYSNY
jgi:hypothetical protein